MMTNVPSASGPSPRRSAAADLRALSLLLVSSLLAGGTVVGAQEVPGASEADTIQPTQVEQLVDELGRLELRIDDVEESLARASAAQATLYEFQRRERWTEHHQRLMQLGAAVEQSADPTADSASIAFGARSLQRELSAGHAWLEEVRAHALALIDTIAELPAESVVEAEIEFSDLNAGIDQLMSALAEDYDLAPIFGLDLADEAAAHDSAMVDRGALLAASLEHGHDRVEELRTWLPRPGVDTTSVNLRIAAMEERVRGATQSLETMAGLLDRRGIDTSDYRRLVLATTGAITTEVLDTRVLGGLFAEWGAAGMAWLRANVPALLLRALLIIVLILAASRLAKVVGSAVKKAIGRLTLSSLIKNLIVSGASKGVWLIAFFIVLSIVGVDLGPMLAGLGIVGFVVGFALQETLANFASGMMIMIYRPFDVGDFVTAGGVTGKVKDLTLVSTVIQTLDNKRIIVPNGKVWGDVINNATAERIRRVDLVFGISYGDDVDHAMSVLEDVLSNDDRVLEHPDYMVRVDSLGDSSVNLFCRPWCRTEDYWDLYWDLHAVVKKRFDAEGISIPFPQRDVHLYGETAPAVQGGAGGG